MTTNRCHLDRLDFLLCFACTIGFAGCSVQPEQEPLARFAIGLFDTAKANDVDSLVANFCVNKRDALEHLDELKKTNPYLQFAGGVDRMTDAEIEKSHRDSIAIFIRSYKDVLAGEPVSWSAAVAEKLNSTKLIMWAKLSDGTYRGALIVSVIETCDGYKVNDWLGPIADRTKDPASLRRKKALLESDTLEGCTFPRQGIHYEYEFVN